MHKTSILKLQKNAKEDLQMWMSRDSPCSYIGKFNIVKLSILIYQMEELTPSSE